MLDIIMLNYKATKQMARSIAGIKKYTTSPYRLTVIDNASGDYGVDWLRIVGGMEKVFNKENKLFTRAYQDFLREKIKDIGEYFVIINNDIIVSEGWEIPLLKIMKENERCGIAAPVLLGMNGQVQNAGGAPDFCSHFTNPEKLKECWWTTFACVMIRKDAFLKVNGFDEQFLFYCSDSDLCLRMILNGYKIYTTSDSQVIHEHMVSTQANPAVQQVGFQDQQKFNMKWARHGVLIGGKNFPVEEKVCTAKL